MKLILLCGNYLFYTRSKTSSLLEPLIHYTISFPNISLPRLQLVFISICTVEKYLASCPHRYCGLDNHAFARPAQNSSLFPSGSRTCIAFEPLTSLIGVVAIPASSNSARVSSISLTCRLMVIPFPSPLLMEVRVSSATLKRDISLSLNSTNQSLEEIANSFNPSW